MRAVFMGTPEIAATILKTVVESGKHEILAVVTQPDKPKGRGQELAYPPVKETALAYQIPVLQPEKVRTPEFLEQLAARKPEIILVAAYGKLLPKQILELPRYGCLNVHASLLPKYRGAAPIQWAVINGEAYSGVTIMHMAEGLDTGDMILSERVALAPEETAGTLHDKLAKLGGPALLQAMEKLEQGTAQRIPQEESEATYVKMIDKSFGQLNFRLSAIQLERLIRGLNPWPTAFTRLSGKLLKIWRAEVISREELTAKELSHVPGAVLRIERNGIGVLTGDGMLLIRELQLEGKRRMTAEEFLRGYPLKPGQMLET